MFDSLYMSTDELLQAMYINSACYLHGTMSYYYHGIVYNIAEVSVLTSLIV